MFQCSYHFRQFVILMICHRTKFYVHSYVSSLVMKLKGSIELSWPVCILYDEMVNKILLKIYQLKISESCAECCSFGSIFRVHSATLVVINRYEKAWFHMKLLVNLVCCTRLCCDQPWLLKFCRLDLKRLFSGTRYFHTTYVGMFLISNHFIMVHRLLSWNWKRCCVFHKWVMSYKFIFSRKNL